MWGPRWWAAPKFVANWRKCRLRLLPSSTLFLPFGGRRRRQRKSNPPSFLPFLPSPFSLDAPRIDKLTSHKKPRAKRYERRQFYYAKFTKNTVSNFSFPTSMVSFKELWLHFVHTCPVEKSMRKQFFLSIDKASRCYIFSPIAKTSDNWPCFCLLAHPIPPFPSNRLLREEGDAASGGGGPTLQGWTAKFSITKKVGFGCLWLQVYELTKS